MCWLTTAAAGVVSVNVFLTSAPHAEHRRPGAGEGDRRGDVAARPADEERAALEASHDGVVDAHEDVAVVVQDAVGEAAPGRGGGCGVPHDRLLGDIAAGHHERREVRATPRRGRSGAGAAACSAA